MSHVTSISENEMNIRIPLCNVSIEWNLEHFSRNLSEKDSLTEKRFKILGKQLLFSNPSSMQDACPINLV